ncbi:MAG: 16S rRNA (cytosine(1402)-N(4))-methyltransferase RsmH [Armatimonadetes bacterium]|nr:16S rRNA (cytosine(1402)-N(4))-methyltransferase RsmH [Armatimonadota bacterium]
MDQFHVPVMLEEVINILQPWPGQTFVDCTVGGAGHAKAIVERIIPGGRLIGIDRDADALRAAAELLSEYRQNVILEKSDFGNLEAVVSGLGLRSIDGILFDLGVSSHQLELAERGFSFRYNAPLDMRMDVTQPITAQELVNSLSERHLAEMIRKYGDEKWAKRIARSIVERRTIRPIETTLDLVEAILAAIPPGAKGGRIHPATRTFQALRIAVNREFESLQAGLKAGIGLLVSGGRLCVLSYHSGEDRIVKDMFARYAGRCTCPPGLPMCSCGAEKIIKILTKRPVTPSEDEVRKNPRARSAKLRAAEKL